MPNSTEVEHLWTLARLLVNENQIHQATVCLDLCLLSPDDSLLALRARILLAECCLSLCQSEPKKQNRPLWLKRYERAQQLIASASDILTADKRDPKAQGEDALLQSWGARWHKAKYLILKWSKHEQATVKNRQTLQTLCSGIQWCYKDPSPVNTSEWAVLLATAKYFISELRSTLVSIHSRAMYPTVDRSPDAANLIAAFEEDLKLVRTSMPSKVDGSFQFWLIEVSCHLLAVSSRYGSISDAKNALVFADRWALVRKPSCKVLRMYHLIIKCFYMLRCGEIKTMSPVVTQLKTISSELQNDASRSESSTMLASIVDSMELEATSRYDPSQAIALSLTAIHRVQANLQVYETHPSYYIMMLGLLFDMLFIHCELHRQQARHYEMGASVVQLLKLFGAYKHLLEPTAMLSYYTVQVHLIVSKYAHAIGRHEQAEVHIRTVLQQHLPPMGESENAYPSAHLRVWNNALDAAMHCSGADHPVINVGGPAQVQQLYPTVSQLNLAARILTTANLHEAMNRCGNIELRARYQFYVCKWLWATNELSESSPSLAKEIHRPETLERLRPDVLSVLHDALELVSTHVNCSEVTAEIMALFGSALLRSGQADNGEETLKNAIRLSLHARNVVLQTKVLVDVFRLYDRRQSAHARAATADKHEKKILQLRRRVAQALADEATVAVILSWSPSNQ